MCKRVRKAANAGHGSSTGTVTCATGLLQEPTRRPAVALRTKAGTRCRVPGMANGRCRMHGGASTGPRTAEGLQRLRQPRITGLRTAAMRELRAELAELRRGAAGGSASDAPASSAPRWPSIARHWQCASK
ncbi:HGGxSTG domain-containing protein [Falsiroseomonas sp. E2-1-a20]|uniref:HGGxSTG domain-containing protein n=1 Tax=Falsiroseomonas sp. E2-1-a20 TaxID=3239300 RepID=UPI003F3B8F3D